MFDRIAEGRHYLWVFLTTFAQTIGRRNDYFWPGRRAGFFFSCFVAHVIANSCAEIRREAAHA